ncbi:MAG TPA: FprA family A-type flavoprotein [Bacteroidales bacterium]|nr:FprA family A-type flavoprotein [Bacteroidales bacterium]
MKTSDSKVLDICKDVSWVGVLDHDILTFDIVMETRQGTTYNSYFINAEKKAVIETVKENFSEVWLSKLRTLTDPADIEYVILDHTEPDHSGSLIHLLEIAREVIVVGSGNAIRYLSDMVPGPFKSMVVKDGDTLDLGNRRLHFISAPNLHWPDSIYTYLEEDRLLFTCDSFGSHYCREEMFDDLVGDFHDSFKYYFDVILKPFSKFMLKAIEKIRLLEINTICTGHGPILRSDWKKLVDITEKYSIEYLKLTDNKPEKNVLITYVSAYGYTKEMAEAIAQGILSRPNMKATVMDIEKIELGELEAEVVKCDALIVGSPTINQNTLLPVYRLFAVINPLRDRGKLSAAFGSYGWSGEAVTIISENLKNLKLKDFGENASFKFMPDETKTIELVSFGNRFADEVVRCNQA